MNLPAHGATRNHRTERDRRTDVFETDAGETLSVSYDGSVMSVHERYCAHCHAWIECRGVTGSLRFMAHHQDGDCVLEAS